MSDFSFADIPEFKPTKILFENDSWNSKEEIQQELGFHEAGHFVIERLLYKTNVENKFSNQNFMMIDSVKKCGIVNGFLLLPESFKGSWTPKNRELFKSHFIENPDLAIASMFSFIAGFATYKKFIADKEYFISYRDNLIQES